VFHHFLNKTISILVFILTANLHDIKVDSVKKYKGQTSFEFYNKDNLG